MILHFYELVYMPEDEWDSYPGYQDEDEDVDCLGPDLPDDWLSEADE